MLICLNHFTLSLSDKCTNEWMVRIEDEIKVESIANLTGFLNIGKIKPFDNIYKFVHPQINNSKCQRGLTKILNKNSDVSYFEH